MTPRRPPRPVDSAAGRLQRILHIAISLTGASAALIVLKDGEVAASAGTPPKGTAAAELAGFGLAFALEAEQGRARQDPAVAWRACAVRDAAGETLGALVLAAARAKAFAPGLDEALPELCALASDELGQAAAAAVLQAEREGLFAEVDHRVKNVIAAVQAMASQSARRAVSLDGFLKAFSGRLKAMASAQELLTATRGRGASLHHLAAAELSALAPGQIRWEGPDLALMPRAASALTLALHELAVNAVKHGALSSEAGRVELRWRKTDDGGLQLDWIETGGPQAPPPARRGFGRMLLEEVTGRELGGQVRMDFTAGGLRARITGAASALTEIPMEPRAPRAAPPPTPAASGGASRARPPAGSVRGLRVIVVEDAILLAVELQAGLTEAGAEVVGQAGEVAEAMALVDVPMDAAVLDCNLNGLSVEPVARALVERGVPFLFATGYGEGQGAPEGFDAPIIRKPYDVAQITAALAQLTGRG